MREQRWSAVPSLFVTLLMIAFALPLALSAQNAEMGVVQGRVFCADTQKPARFAFVRLQPVGGENGAGSGEGFATTGPDGAFRMTGVAAGDYYVDVTMPGYVQPLRGHSGDLQQMPDAAREQLAAQLTRVSVAGNQPVAVQVTIYRGDTITGTITYDDGAPAPGVLVQAFAAAPDASTSSQTAANAGQGRRFGAGVQADDRGQYRLSGLSDGIYTVQATPRSIFPVFYGNTIEATKAKKLDVHSGDDATGIDIQVPAAGMHHVSGVVTSQQDGHAVARAAVQLSLASGTNSIRTVSGVDGSFSFPAVPDGKFNAQVSGYDPSSHGRFSGAGQAVEVNGGDVNDLVLTVPSPN